MRPNSWLMLLMGTVLILSGWQMRGNAEQPRLNFLFVIADDCTWSDLGVYGGQAKTPVLDELAREGMLFQRCFQAAPICSPTRHCLFTGLYPVRSGAHPNHTFVKPEVRSIAHYLKDGGYRVALSGKRHIHPPENFPFEYSKSPDEAGRERNPDFDAVEKFLKECSQEEVPFALFLCSTEPHTPYTQGDPAEYPLDEIQLPPHYVDTPATRSLFQKYLAEITYFDKQVGRALKLLSEANQSDSTMVMVVSEQGNSFPFAKWTCYEAGVRSGMIVRWPGHVSPGTVTDAMVEYVDIVPTFLEAAGVQTPPELDGRSFLSVLLGESDHHKNYTYSIQTSRGIYHGPEHFGIRSVRGERYRYVRNLTPDAMFQNSVLNTRWWKSWEQQAKTGNAHAKDAITRYVRRPAEELYDCLEDPWNQTNLAGQAEYQGIQADLSDRLDEWMVDQGDLGQATEMDALNRQWDFDNDRPLNSSPPQQ